MEDEPLPELMTPYEAVELLAPSYGTIETKRIIADRMRDGEIRAYARQSWVSTDQKLKDARNGKAPAKAKRNVLIGCAKLVGAERWVDEATLWKWRKGDFHSVIRSRPVKRRIFRGVRLVKADIERIWRIAAEHEKLKNNAGGRPRNESAWDRVFIALLELIRSHEVDIHNPSAYTELAGQIIRKLGGDQPMAAAFANKSNAEIEALKSARSPLSGSTIEQWLKAVYGKLGLTTPRKRSLKV